MLNSEEKERYNRHLILDQVGLQGQVKLKNAKVLVIGAGGLGCPILAYLTAAGVGQIGIIDFDSVDVSNLQRQVLFSVDDIGQNKAEAAAKRLGLMNPLVRFDVYPERLTTKNALELFAKYDIVVDGTDNFSTRYLVNDASVISNKPLVYGSIYKFQGQIAVFNYKNGPSYRCLFPTPPKHGTIKNCSEIGVIGVLPGVVGTQQANEAIKIILGIGQPLSGKLMVYDALNASYMQVDVQRSNEEVEKVLNQADQFSEMDYDLFCGVDKQVLDTQITWGEFETLLNNEEVQIVDLREEWEQPTLNASNLIRIPMETLAKSVDQLNKDKKIVLVCQSGNRSKAALAFIKGATQLENIVELKDGLKYYGK